MISTVDGLLDSVESNRPSTVEIIVAFFSRSFQMTKVTVAMRNDQFWRHIESLPKGTMMIDGEFPAVTKTISRTQRFDQVVWLRPAQISDKPYLLVDGMTRDDIMQQSLGDCWFLSAVSAIAQHPELLRRVVPDHHSLSTKINPRYKGCVRFHFWQFGEWIEVVVDDQLPTVNRRLIFAKCSDANEFWVALLEKAYAKIHGSYDALQGGNETDAFVDLTGGLAEAYDMKKEDHRRLYDRLYQAIKGGSFITCSKSGNWQSASSQSADRYGIIAGHAYTITNVRQIRWRQETVNLLRIRNPWGRGQEWKGAWCDDDRRWREVDNYTKDRLEFVQKEDGEFWMSYSDFTRHFEDVTICTAGPDFDKDGVVDRVGSFLTIYGAWSGRNAGGCRNNVGTFSQNPQFLLHVRESDHANLFLDNQFYQPWMTSRSSDTCGVVMGLMQEDKRVVGETKSKDYYEIGFLLYPTSNPNKRLSRDFIERTKRCGDTGAYVNRREVYGRFDLRPGNYVIIPSTYYAKQQARFLLRIYAAKPITCVELKE